MITAFADEVHDEIHLQDLAAGCAVIEAAKTKTDTRKVSRVPGINSNGEKKTRLPVCTYLIPARGPFMKTFFRTMFARDLALK